MSQLKGYSPLTDDVLELGEKTEDLDRILELGDYMATIAEESLIVFVEGPALQKWEST